MPRTKSSKKYDQTPLEKFQRIDSAVDRLIFFKYYDGYYSDGNVGFDIHGGPDGSTKHYFQDGIFKAAMTKDQFRMKGKRLALLAKRFIDKEETPPMESRPQIDIQQVENIREERRDKRSLTEKLQLVSDSVDLFIFFKYYDGFYSKGEYGFNPGSGGPGSVNHKRAYTRVLGSMKESQFRDKGKSLGNLAKEFVENGIDPPSNRRPQNQERKRLHGMMEAADYAGYDVHFQN
jgi:hypothetical protein